MNGVCHRITGTIAGATTFVACAHPNTPAAVVTGCVVGGLIGGVGGLIPDLDKTGSKIANKFPITAKITEFTLGHRGLLHTPFFVLMVMMIYYAVSKNTSYSLNNVAIFSFFAGYMSHILLDYLTPQGIMMLYPISKKRFHLIGLKGRLRDLFVGTIIMIVFGVYISLYVSKLV